MDLFVGRGRVGRLQYFLTNVALVIVGAVGYRMLADHDAFAGTYEPTTPALVLVGVVAWLYVMNIVRRLHDRAHSGFMALLLVVPFVGVAVALYLLFAPGTPGWNRFGTTATGTRPPGVSPDDLDHEQALADAEQRNRPFVTEDGAFDMDGLFRDSDINRS